ncbi:MAG: undecaprenyldiphospho-muramoylpentapeptide beta-N-acetylglucosaminyltransferase [Clostridiaceae bacterium]
MTGGGTAGHVTPNLALVPKLKEAGFEIKYIGSKDGIEKEIIAKEGIEYYSISSGKLRRYFDIKNFSDPFKVVKGLFDALGIMSKEKPDAVFSKGGFVAVPVVMAASIKGIPVIAHESDMTPGLANKLSAPFCSKLCVTFPESLEHVKNGKGVLTGAPIREDILKGDKERGKKIAGFNDNKEIILVMGGSLGSKIINETLRENLKTLLKNFNIIHICGKGNYDKTLNSIKGYAQFEYVSEELPHLMKSSDYVISRAGSNSIFEFLALKKPMLLIPLSRKASRGDQIMNAESFRKAGYSLVIEEEELTAESFVNAVRELKNRGNSMKEKMEESPLKNGVESIINIIVENIRK